MPKLHRLRLNPSADDARVARAMAILEDTSLDPDVAADLANRILAGEEIAEALTGTGLVVDTSPQPAQIAEVQTAQGVVEVPVTEAVPQPAPRAHGGSLHERVAAALDWSVAEAQTFSLPTLADLVNPVDAALAAEIRDAVRSGSHIRGTPLTVPGSQLWEAPARLSPVEEAISEINRAIHIARTTTQRKQTEGLRESAQRLLERLSTSDLKKVAENCGVDLRGVPADRRVKQIIEHTFGFVLRSRALRGDYEEDRAEQDREREGRQQRMIASYREREGLPPLPTPPPPALTPSTVPSFDEFIQQRLASWHKHSKPVSFEELTAESNRSVDHIISTAIHAAQESIEAIQVYAAVKDLRTFIDWIVATNNYRKDNLSFFKKIADKQEPRAMLLLRNEYEKKYGVSPPRSNPRFIRRHR